MRKFISAALVAATLATGFVPAAAYADRWGNQRQRYYNGNGYGHYDRGYRGYNRGYDRHYYGGRGYAHRGGYRHHCDRGTGGTIIGAIAGGLAGNAVVGRRGDHTLGTIAGAGLGAVAGRAIDRDC